MKILTAILLSVTILLSCGLSKSKKEHIRTMILLHNSKAYYKFSVDSLKEMERESIRYIKIHKTEEFKEYLRAHGITFKNQWNQPYEISKDYNLSLDKYIEYCKANGKDVETFYKFMD